MQGKGELTISSPAGLQAALSDLTKEKGQLRDIKFHPGFRTDLASALSLVDAVAHNSTLIILDLSRCPIGDQGAQSVATMLERNTTLKELRLDDCSISYFGCMALAEALRLNGSLLRLSLRGNSVQHAGGEALLRAVTEANGTLRTLDLAHTSMALSQFSGDPKRLSVPLFCLHVPAPTSIAISTELSRLPSERIRRIPRFQFVIRCIFMISHERRSPTPARISSLPKDTLFLIMRQFLPFTSDTANKLFALALDAPRIREAIRKRAASTTTTQLQVLPLQP